MTVRTWLARVSLTGAAGLCVLAALPTSVLHAQDPEAGRPAAWGGEAAANGLFYTTDQRPSMSPIVEFIYAGTPEGKSTFDSSGTAEGRASSYYAGGGGSNAVSLLCLAGFPCSQFPGLPPEYPFSATAEWPSKPDASPQASGNDAGFIPGLTPGTVKAHADRKYVETIASANGFSSVPGSAQSATSTTRQEFVKGVLVVRAESVVKGISIGGGVIKIDEVRAVSVARADGKKLLGDESTVTVTGVTVAGQPGAIDDRGVHVAGQSDNALVKGANDALKVLASQGITARVVGVSRTVDRAAGSLQATASGVQVSYSHKASGIPTPPPGVPPDPFPGVPNPNRVYYGTMLLGAAGTSIYADDTRFDDIEVPEVDNGVVPGFDPGPGTQGGSGTTPTISDPRTPVVDAGGVVRPQVRRPARAASARRVSFGLLPKSVADRIELLYIAGMLTVLGALAGGRLGAPSRLPRALAAR